MNSSTQLDQYIASFRDRLKKLTLIQGLAVLALVLLVVSVAGAWFSIEQGFASGTVITSRLLLLAALGVTAFFFLYTPLKKLGSQLSHQIEHRSPDFRGRIETYLDMKEANNPFTDLLAEDALKISNTRPVTQTIEQKEFTLASAVGALALVVLLYLIIAGPGLFNFGLRNLLGGWAFDDLLPPQSIAVTPGDQSVRRGANLRISSVMEGFDPDEATIHVKNGDKPWQEVSMVSGPNGFEFTFFSMQEDMQYYVSTTGLRSPSYDVRVVDVPSIENLSLTYHFPDWTQREAETIEPGGDISALADTRIELKVTTSAPLQEGGTLVLNKTDQPLEINGVDATTDFTITEEGEYYLAALVGDEQVRLSDDYFIRITEDGRPVIEFVRPGQDYNASNIEEVLTIVEAKDDYGLENVALKYSVNGGEWVSVDLNPEHVREITAEHMFMLEEILVEVEPVASSTQVGAFNVVIEGEDEEAEAAESDTGRRPPPTVGLAPGDLISYYAEASDRSSVERTDMFFIQIQPFNRRYSQSQMSGGGGGGQQGGPQDEISQRQRQIIVSTWNLLREQSLDADNPSVNVNSALLSDLQLTLAEQAQTLAERSRARQLGRDDQIEEFINSIEQAVLSMHPAADKLAAIELDEAIQPAQEALQHLLHAESIFNDITVSQQQGGGGGQAQRDLAEMYELEMDIEKNQYETGNQASSSQSQQQEAEDIMKQLDELAKRQEQLARNLRNQQQLTDAQRWQQDMLRREAEELQERLDQLERQQSNQRGQQQNQQASNQQGQQQGQPGQPGQAGQQGGQAGQPGDPSRQQSQEQGEQNQQVAQSELQRRLDSAIRAMNETSEAMRGNQGPQDLQRAAEEAQRQLEGARDEVAQQQIANMQQSFSSMAGQGQQMLNEQRRMQQQLQEAAERALADREDGKPDSRGMSLTEEWELAREKQQLADNLQQLQQQMLNTMQQFNEQVPDASRELNRATDQLAENELERAISDAAIYIENGYSMYIAGNESAITEAMRSLSDSLERAEDLALGASSQNATDLDRALAQAQQLRNQMQQQLAQNGQPGNQPGQAQNPQPSQQQEQQRQAQGQQQNNQQAQNGQGQQPGQQSSQQSSQQPGNQPGQQNNGGQRGNQAGSGGWWTSGNDTLQGPINLPDNFFNNLDTLTDTARGAIPDMNLGGEDLARMYDLIRELEYTRVNRNDAILAQEFNDMLALIEQLEVGLKLDEPGDRNNVRTAIQDAIPEEYQDSVAEYYRRLSKDDN